MLPNTFSSIRFARHCPTNQCSIKIKSTFPKNKCQAFIAQARTFASLYLSQTMIASFHPPGFLPFPLMSWPSADITCARCPRRLMATCGLWLVTSSDTDLWLVRSDSLSVMRRQWWHSVSVTVSQRRKRHAQHVRRYQKEEKEADKE